MKLSDDILKTLEDLNISDPVIKDTIEDAKRRASKIVRRHPIQYIENPVKQA